MFRYKILDISRGDAFYSYKEIIVGRVIECEEKALRVNGHFKWSSFNGKFIDGKTAMDRTNNDNFVNTFFMAEVEEVDS